MSKQETIKSTQSQNETTRLKLPNREEIQQQTSTSEADLQKNLPAGFGIIKKDGALVLVHHDSPNKPLGVISVNSDNSIKLTLSSGKDQRIGSINPLTTEIVFSQILDQIRKESSFSSLVSYVNEIASYLGKEDCRIVADKEKQQVQITTKAGAKVVFSLEESGTRYAEIIGEKIPLALKERRTISGLTPPDAIPTAMAWAEIIEKVALPISDFSTSDDTFIGRFSKRPQFSSQIDSYLAQNKKRDEMLFSKDFMAAWAFIEKIKGDLPSRTSLAVNYDSFGTNVVFINDISNNKLAELYIETKNDELKIVPINSDYLEKITLDGQPIKKHQRQRLPISIDGIKTLLKNFQELKDRDIAALLPHLSSSVLEYTRVEPKKDQTVDIKKLSLPFTMNGKQFSIKLDPKTLEFSLYEGDEAQGKLIKKLGRWEKGSNNTLSSFSFNAEDIEKAVVDFLAK